MEQDLHPAVAFGILPVFAFANAGIPFDGITLDSFFHPVPLGIAAGLFFGNQVGVLGFSWIAIKLGISRLPREVKWIQLYGVALLCGIGFTMSLFVASLAFEQGGPDYAVDDRLGVMLGSLISGVCGYIVLRLFSKEDPQT
jgi:NhaA family Na+:H+ antiporter